LLFLQEYATLAALFLTMARRARRVFFNYGSPRSPRFFNNGSQRSPRCAYL
jgi:hypothetical protein